MQSVKKQNKKNENEFKVVIADQGLAIFYKKSDNKYFRLYKPHDLCHNYNSALKVGNDP